MADPRHARRDPDWTDREAEGMPAVEDQPPGIDAESAVEGEFPPRDVPLAVDEPEVTAAGERAPETLEERVRREQPERTSPDEGLRGRLVDEPTDDEPAEGEWSDDAAGLSAEEDAVHVREL